MQTSATAGRYVETDNLRICVYKSKWSIYTYLDIRRTFFNYCGRKTYANKGIRIVINPGDLSLLALAISTVANVGDKNEEKLCGLLFRRRSNMLFVQEWSDDTDEAKNHFKLVLTPSEALFLHKQLGSFNAQLEHQAKMDREAAVANEENDEVIVAVDDEIDQGLAWF